MEIIEYFDWLVHVPLLDTLGFEEELLGVTQEWLEIEGVIGVLEDKGQEIPAVEGVQIKIIMEKYHVFPLLNELVQIVVASTRILVFGVGLKTITQLFVVACLMTHHELLRNYSIDINFLDNQIENLLVSGFDISHLGDRLIACILWAILRDSGRTLLVPFLSLIQMILSTVGT